MLDVDEDSQNLSCKVQVEYFNTLCFNLLLGSFYSNLIQTQDCWVGSVNVTTELSCPPTQENYKI